MRDGGGCARACLPLLAPQLPHHPAPTFLACKGLVSTALQQAARKPTPLAFLYAPIGHQPGTAPREPTWNSLLRRVPTSVWMGAINMRAWLGYIAPSGFMNLRGKARAKGGRRGGGGVVGRGGGRSVS